MTSLALLFIWWGNGALSFSYSIILLGIFFSIRVGVNYSSHAPQRTPHEFVLRHIIWIVAEWCGDRTSSVFIEIGKGIFHSGAEERAWNEFLAFLCTDFANPLLVAVGTIPSSQCYELDHDFQPHITAEQYHLSKPPLSGRVCSLPVTNGVPGSIPPLPLLVRSVCCFKSHSLLTATGPWTPELSLISSSRLSVPENSVYFWSGGFD